MTAKEISRVINTCDPYSHGADELRRLPDSHYRLNSVSINDERFLGLKMKTVAPCGCNREPEIAKQKLAFIRTKGLEPR